MRPWLPGVFLAAVAMFTTVHAADTSLISQRAAGLRPETLAQLPKPDQDRVLAAYQKALMNNPDLKKEGDALVESDKAKDATTPAGQSMVEKSRTYQIKVRQAMLKEDPTIAPVLTQIDQLTSAMRAQNQSNADTPKPAAPAPPAK